jgi:hypothetical protein
LNRLLEIALGRIDLPGLELSFAGREGALIRCDIGRMDGVGAKCE